MSFTMSMVFGFKFGFTMVINLINV